MTVYSSARSSRASALTPEIWFCERGASVHEFYLVKAGHLAPVMQGWMQIGILDDEAEYDEFIDYCEGTYSGRLRLSHVRYSWANWKRYQRKKRKTRSG